MANVNEIVAAMDPVLDERDAKLAKQFSEQIGESVMKDLNSLKEFQASLAEKNFITAEDMETHRKMTDGLQENMKELSAKVKDVRATTDRELDENIRIQASGNAYNGMNVDDAIIQTHLNILGGKHIEAAKVVEAINATEVTDDQIEAFFENAAGKNTRRSRRGY